VRSRTLGTLKPRLVYRVFNEHSRQYGAQLLRRNAGRYLDYAKRLTSEASVQTFERSFRPIRLRFQDEEKEMTRSPRVSIRVLAIDVLSSPRREMRRFLNSG